MSNVTIFLEKFAGIVVSFSPNVNPPFELGWGWQCMECEEGEEAVELKRFRNVQLGDIHFKSRNEILRGSSEKCSCSSKICSLSKWLKEVKRP